jgi:hypothetical protein
VEIPLLTGIPTQFYVNDQSAQERIRAHLALSQHLARSGQLPPVNKTAPSAALIHAWNQSLPETPNLDLYIHFVTHQNSSLPQEAQEFVEKSGGNAWAIFVGTPTILELTRIAHLIDQNPQNKARIYHLLHFLCHLLPLPIITPPDLWDICSSYFWLGENDDTLARQECGLKEGEESNIPTPDEMDLICPPWLHHHQAIQYANQGLDWNQLLPDKLKTPPKPTPLPPSFFEHNQLDTNPIPLTILTIGNLTTAQRIYDSWAEGNANADSLTDLLCIIPWTLEEGLRHIPLFVENLSYIAKVLEYLATEPETIKKPFQ